MPKLTVESYGTFDVADNKRLVLAIEQDAKVDILHACGGNARCTTCRVEFIDGEPSAMTAAEKERLEQRGLSGVRLSCQIVCDHDMTVRAISRLEGSGRPDPGRTPEETIQPPPVWGHRVRVRRVRSGCVGVLGSRDRMHWSVNVEPDSKEILKYRERRDQGTHFRVVRHHVRMHTGRVQRRGADWPDGGHDDVALKRVNKVVAQTKSRRHL